MSATELTTQIQLPRFIATDKPSWLGDWNVMVNKIDAAFAAKEAQINTLTTQLNAANARITALAAATGHVGI